MNSMADTSFQRIAMPKPANPVEPSGAPLIEIANLSLHYGAARALKDINLQIRERVVTAFIGPSGWL